MTFVGVEIQPKNVVWIDASADHHVFLSNACLVKHPKKENARVILEIWKPENEEQPADDQESKRVAIAVLSACAENAKLDLPITSRLGLSIAGKSATGAIVHVVGNEYEFSDDDDGEIELAPGMMGMQVVIGEADDHKNSSSDDDNDSMKDDDLSNSEEEDEAKKKLVVRKQSKGLPVVNHRSGLKFQDIIIGHGKRVVPGRNVAIKYTLRLENGKVIDKAEARKPFKFRLGVGECVKGFDIGVRGMREGGERHLIVPPDLAYGQHPPPGIPRNATLYFDVTVIKAF
ncbi:unnamed protein product [Agarophyton chilense]